MTDPSPEAMRVARATWVSLSSSWNAGCSDDALHAALAHALDRFRADGLDDLRWKLTDKALVQDEGQEWEGKWICLDDFHEVWDRHIHGDNDNGDV